MKKTLVTPQKDDNLEEPPQDVQTPLYPNTNSSGPSEHINVEPVLFDPAIINIIEPEPVLPKTEAPPIEIEATLSKEPNLTFQHEMYVQQFAPVATVHHNQFASTATAHPNQFAPTVNHNQFAPTLEPEVNVTEILISNKRSLENQISELQTKLLQLESSQTTAMNENYFCKQQIISLQQDIQIIQQKYFSASEELNVKDATIKEMEKLKLTLTDENNNLQEQLEFTKTMLTAKESENTALQNQLKNLQNQLDVTQLHLQQISNGNQINFAQQKKEHDTELLLQKLSTLEHQLKTMQKERDQINVHYEHYVAELNEQLKTLAIKNEELNAEVTRLSNRETGLIEQISDMEIRLQNFQIIAKRQPFVDEPKVYEELQELQQKYGGVQVSLNKF